MTTIPPLVWTTMMTSYCQLMNGIDAVPTHAQKARTELTQIPSRQRTDFKAGNPNQSSSTQMETILGCQSTPPQSPSQLKTFLTPANHARWQPARSQHSSAAPPPIEGMSGMKSNKNSKVRLYNKAAFNLEKDLLRSVQYTENPWPAS